MNIDEITKRELIDYVKDQHLDTKSEKNIQDFCADQNPLSITVYRGHKKSQTIRQNLWYSASKSEKVAAEEFSGKDCCVFVVHLINIPCIDINYYIEDYIGDKAEEKEVIFLGGGKFYKNENLTEEGYISLGKGKYNRLKFECWYSMEKNHEEVKLPKRNKIEEALSIIPEDEYDLIENSSDIVVDGLDLTEEEKDRILNEIQRRKGEINGGKRRRRRNTRRKRNSRRKNTRRKRNTRRRH